MVEVPEPMAKEDLGIAEALRTMGHGEALKVPPAAVAALLAALFQLRRQRSWCKA
jgi:hypothetical protein